MRPARPWRPTARCCRARPGPRCATTCATRPQSPIRANYRGDRPWSFKTQRGIFSTPVIGADGTAYVGSADTSFYAIDRDGNERWRFAHRRDHRRRRRARPGLEQRRVPDHDRLRRRDALPAAQLEPQALAGQAHPLDLPHPLAAGDRPARQLVGGQRRLRARLEPLRRQHRRRRLLAHPRRPAALDHPARQLGVDDPGLRRRGQQLLGLGRLLRVLARPGGQPALADVHPRLPDLVAGARLRRHRLHRLVRPLAARARPGDRRRALGVPDRRPHLQLAGARLRRRRQHDRDLHRLGRRLGVRASRPTAISCGATTPATRCAPRR